MDNEFLLMDRIDKIRAINEQYDLENNAYISFSGGKDSVVLHYLIDLALPDNRIPRVFFNTGIEYTFILQFVKELAAKDDRIIIYNSNVNIRKMLRENGFPFKSKEHSHKLAVYQNSGRTKSIIDYLGDGKKNSFLCPKKLKYQFTKDFNLKISDKCCQKLKKEVGLRYQKEYNRTITITGMLKAEGGYRTRLSCIITSNDNQLVKFHPLSIVDKEFENWFIKKYGIKLCKLYYPPYNFLRTGCAGCPFALNLQDELDKLEILLPNERKRVELIWKPVYDEYRRIGYRLRKEDKNQLNIFDFSNK